MKIAFLGDSITVGHTLENPGCDRYSSVVCRALGADEINLGICGTLIARAGMNRLPDNRSFCDRVEQMAGADFGVVFGGTNDYFWTDSPIEVPTAERESDEYVYFRPATARVFDRMTDTFGADRTLVITPYPHHGYGNYRHAPGYCDARWHDTDAPNIVGMCLEDYCDVLREEAGKRGMPLLDLFRAFGCHSAGFDWQNLTTDGCHPNTRGHQLIADAVLKALSDRL